MKSAWRSVGVVALFAALNVAGWIWTRGEARAAARDGVRVVRTGPQSVEGAGELWVELDRKLATPEELGVPLLAAPFEIEPPLAGSWHWSQPDRLGFELAEPPPAGRRWRMRATPRFEEVVGRPLRGEQEFAFATPALELRACSLEAADDDGVLLALWFNQPVAAEDVARHLEIDGVDPERLELVQSRVGERLLVHVPPVEGDVLRLRLSAGLRGPGAELGLAEDFQRTLALRTTFALLGSEANQPYGSDQVLVALHFSTALDPVQTLPPIACQPPVEGLDAHVDGNRLRLSGAFAAGTRYSVRLDGPLLARGGAVLDAGASTSVTLPHLRPAVSLPFARGYLSPRGHLELDLRATSVAGVRVRAWRVHDNNLVAHVRGEGERATARSAPELEVPLALQPDEPTDLAVDLRALTGGLPGVWGLEVASTEDRWVLDRGLVTITDLGLTAKRAPDAVLAWVVSLETGRPVEGAQVETWSYNGQLLAGVLTGPDGCARLEVLPEHPDGPPYLVRAVAGDDVTFLPASSFGLDAGDADVSGRAPSGELDVLLYAARDVHRPGDEVQLTGIVRDPDGGTPGSTSLLVHARRPDGRLVEPRAVRAFAAEQGLFTLAVPTREEDPTGAWRFWVTLADRQDSLAQVDVLVEPFVPVRIEVAATSEHERVFAPDAPVIDVQADYLVGRPAALLRATLNGRLVPRAFRSPRHGGFVFDGASASDEHDAPRRAATRLDEVEARLDEGGHARIAPKLPPNLAGTYTAELSATVSEDGGRSVSSQVELVVEAARRHLGLRLPAGTGVQPGEPFEVEWIQVDADGEPAPGAAHLRLSRLDRRWELRSVDGRMRWTPIDDAVPVEERALEAAAGGAGRMELACPTWGDYALDAVDDETGLTTRLVLSARGAGQEALPGAAPDRVTLALDRERYRPGETARVHVEAPFAGTLLLTLEGERLLAHRVVEVPQGPSELELELPDALRGGAFVAAELVRPIALASTSWEAHRARGLTRLLADHETRRLDVALDAPAECAPLAHVKVELDVGAVRDPEHPPFVQVWAVDEGILLAGGTRTPDPFEHFLGPRRASLETAQTWSQLLPDAERPASLQRIGGDADAQGEALRRRRGDVRARHREAAVIVLAPRAVGPDGRLAVELDLPELTGAMRLMAVAVDGDAYGSAERRIVLTTPLVVEATWPRCAAPGDELEVPVTLMNTTAEALAVELAFEGPLAPAEAPRAVRLEPGAEARLRVRARAEHAGAAEMVVRALARTESGATLESRARADVIVREATLLHSETRWMRGEAGQELALAPEADFRREGLRLHVWVGPRPQVELEPVLRELIDYPYGCVEQTTSRLIGLLYAVRAGSEASGVQAELQRARSYLHAGLERLRTMQTASGGLAYWPGDARPTVWGSAYAAGFLARARREGVELDRGFVDPLLDYLERALPRDEDVCQQAEVCAALAAFERPDTTWMSWLSERRDRLDATARAHLARAWLDAGRRDRALEALGDDTLRLTTQRTTGGRLVSSVVADATLLETLLELDPEHPWVTELVERLRRSRADRGWNTTLAQATGLAALSVYQELALADSHYEGELVSADGQSWPLTSEAALELDLRDVALPLTLRTQGEGPVFAALLADGFTTAPVERYDHGLWVRRRWLTPAGEALDLSRPVRSGDLVLCEIEVATTAPTDDAGVDNLAVVVALPGGLEVENPRLATASRAIPRAELPDRVEFDDDRVLLFTSATPKARRFVIPLRAVNVGEYALPRVQASCMYDPEVASVTDGGHLSVVR